MQPYQRATEEIRAQGERPVTAVQNAASLATSTGIGARILPFLSKYVPDDLAVKGLSKIDPRLGRFIDKAMSEGQPVSAIKDFIKGKAEEFEQSQAKPQEPEEEEDIILRFSPKLSEFVRKAVKNGSPISEVEALARSPGQKFNKTIQHLEKSLGMTFYDVLRSIYGGSKKGTQPNSTASAQILQQPVAQMQAPVNQATQQQPISQQPAGQPGQGQAALMAILQKIQQSRGAQ